MMMCQGRGVFDVCVFARVASLFFLEKIFKKDPSVNTSPRRINTQ